MDEGPQEPPSPSTPGGAVYDWYRRGVALLEARNPDAAAQVLAHAAEAEPGARAVREALARAHFDAGHYEAARDLFRELAGADPADDYALFGVGVSSARLGDLSTAVEHLALASAMRPELGHYRRALAQARARLGASAG